MVLDGARIYNEGITIGDGIKSRIRQIVHTIKTLSPASDISMKFIKCGHVYEGLVWGTVNRTPIGIYNRGPSMGLVLETIFKRAKKECLRTAKIDELHLRSKRFPSTHSLPLAG